MRRTYKKPEICVEDFRLSEMIAACNYTINLQTTDNCATNVSEDIIMAGWKALGLFSATDNCEDPVGSGTELIWNGTKLCYHTSQGAGVFAS